MNCKIYQTGGYMYIGLEKDGEVLVARSLEADLVKVGVKTAQDAIQYLRREVIPMDTTFGIWS